MTALFSGKLCTIFPEKSALNFWKACTIALEYSNMELLKDLVKIFIEGMMEWWAECKISSKRQEYFINKKSKIAKVCYYGTVSVCILLILIGIIACIREKVLEGIICMSISGGIGMWLLVERGTAEK